MGDISKARSAFFAEADNFHQEFKMKQLRNIFIQYPLVLFFLLTYLLSWWTVPVADGALFPYGPTLAAILVLAIGQGRRGLSQWWARLTQWRGGRWYLIGPALIAISVLGAFGLYFAFGPTSIAFPKLPVPAAWLELLLLGGLWEEPGWTGYALPKLQEKFSEHKNGMILATLTLGLLRAIWHLPLMVRGTLPWFDVFGYSFIMQILIAWLYYRSAGSVPVVMVFHYASNVLAGGIIHRSFAGSEKLALQLLFTICIGLIGLIILLRDGSFLTHRTRPVNMAGSPTLSGEN